MTNYQKRMTRFVWAIRIYAVSGGLGIAINTGWLTSIHVFVWWSTVTLLYCLAVGFDAVYDSLAEQLPPKPLYGE